MIDNDKAFITFPDRGRGWPHWPYCPLRKASSRTGGTVIDKTPLGKPINREDECFRTVYLKTIWEAAESGGFKTAEKKVYESVDAMLADGWSVD